MTTIKREATVAHSVEQMYDLVNDIESYPQFLPWCSESHVDFRNEDEVRAGLTLAMSGISKTFSTHNRLQKNKMIEIRLVDGPFKQLEGFWRFERTASEGCRIQLDLDFEMSSGMLSFVIGPIFHQIANTLVDAFVDRADVLFGKTHA